jgi:Bacterial Ig domain
MPRKFNRRYARRPLFGFETLEQRHMMSVSPPSVDLTEGNAAEWQTFASDNAAASVSNDTSKVREGTASLRFDTVSGFDTGVRMPSGAENWNLNGYTVIDFWVYGDNNTPIGWQGNQPIVKLTSPTGSLQLAPNRQVMPNHAWASIHVPIAGDAVWQRTEAGSFDVTNVTGMEFHQDTWDFGFTVYYDGVHIDDRGASDLPPPGPDAPPGVNPDGLSPRVLLYFYDPIMENRDGQRAHDSFHWEDPADLASRIVQEFNTNSHGRVNFQIVDTIIEDGYGYFKDGFIYNDISYTEAVFDPAKRHNDQFDYVRFINEHNLAARVDSGEIDEVWIYAFPFNGTYESAMAGKGRYWINGGTDFAGSERAFPIMGLNYEAGFANALHSFGHRSEGHMDHIYGGTANWNGSTWVPHREHNWAKYVYLDKYNPGAGLGGVGNIHFPVNGTSDYDYGHNVNGDLNPVLSLADNWANYPDIESGAARLVDRRDWQRADGDWHRGYMDWWYSHLPHFEGRGNDYYLNNWWRYLFDINQYKYGNASLYLTTGRGQVKTIAPSSGIGIVPVRAEAFVDGALGRVDLYVDGQFYATDAIAPFTFDLNADALGSGGHELVTKMYELQNGTEAVSEPLTFYKELGATPPVIWIDNTPVGYRENDNPKVIVPEAVLTDVDSADFSGGRLTVQIVAGAQVADRLRIRNQGTGADQIGVANGKVTYEGRIIGNFVPGTGGTPLRVWLNANATPASVQRLLRNIAFWHDGDNPSAISRNVRFTISDGDGGSSAPVQKSLTITSVNDAPVLTVDSSASYTENDVPIGIAPNAIVTDVDNRNFGGGWLKAIITANAQTGDHLTVRNTGTGAGQIGIDAQGWVTYGGVRIGRPSGLNTVSLSVALTNAATPTAVQELLRNISFYATGDNPLPNVRTISFQANDGDGSASAIASTSLAVIAVNDKPVVTVGGPVNYTRNSSGVYISQGSTVSDVDSSDFDGGRLSLQVAQGIEVANRLEIRGVFTVLNNQIKLNGVVIGVTNSGGGVGTTDLRVRFNANATSAIVRQLVRSVYFHTVGSSSTETRLITYQLSDGDGGTSDLVSKQVNIFI